MVMWEKSGHLTMITVHIYIYHPMMAHKTPAPERKTSTAVSLYGFILYEPETREPEIVSWTCPDTPAKARECVVYSRTRTTGELLGAALGAGGLS